MANTSLLTSESVADGHPDKICDQISDAIIDACLAQDPNSRVAVEAAIKNETVFVFGELSSKADLHIEKLVKQTLTDIGHGDARWGVDLDKMSLITAITQQSGDIAQGVDRETVEETGAGDQGMMFGFACKDTDALMPLPIQLAHRIMERQREVRLTADGAGLGPDAKSQVTVVYEDGRPTRVDTVVLSTQHAEALTLAQVEALVRELVVKPVVPEAMITAQTRYLINPTGRFIVGGPVGDAGLTGRKIIVDTYGGAGRHGGGAFSGKDPTKVDRSAAYACRQLAKSIVASGHADQAEIQVSYAIGVAEPVSISLWMPHVPAGAGQEVLVDVIPNAYELMRPAQIIQRLGLQRPMYREIARFGHFGRPGLPWEQVLAG